MCGARPVPPFRRPHLLTYWDFRSHFIPLEVPPEQYPSIAVFETEETKLDLLIAKTAFEHQAVRESLLLGDGEDAIAAVRPEDLIVYKLIANRTRDREDIAAVIERLIAREQTIDWQHIEEYASAFGIEQRAEWARELARNVEHGLGR